MGRHVARHRRRAATTIAVAFIAYLALSVILWWQVWSTHPTTVTTCGCEDPSLFLWFLEWPAYAIAHAHNPFFSTALFHPEGINLLANTSVLAIGIPLAPVTWLFGPVATLNVASTLTPALSALSMFWLLRRWVSWTPAAFLGGLAFGFSPFVLVNTVGAHFMTGVVALFPLMIGCLDELLIRQRRRASAVGVGLGLLVTVQFFLGTEALAVAMVCGAAGLVLLVAYGAIGHRAELVARTPHALRGLGAAAATSVVLLAYPTWFALDGPAHFSGLVWPMIKPGTGGTTFADLWSLHFANPQVQRLFGGYQGPVLPQAEYFGIGALVVVAAGVVLWRRDRRLWLFGALGVVAAALSFGLNGRWAPWRLFVHLPVLENVLPGRITAITLVCVAVMLGIVIGRVHDAVLTWTGQRRLARRTPRASESRRRMSRTDATTALGAVAAGAALAVAAVALVPMATAFAGNAPFTMTSATPPRWFTDIGSRLPPGQVVLTFPLPATGGSTMAWQAMSGLNYAVATGSGPEGIASRAGRERAGQVVLTNASSTFSTLSPATAANVTAVRHALAGWGVTRVVVPVTTGMYPVYDRTSSTAWALGLFTAAIGRRPQFREGAWVWKDVRSPSPRRAISVPAFRACTTVPRGRGPSRQAVPDCVLAASQPA